MFQGSQQQIKPWIFLKLFWLNIVRFTQHFSKRTEGRASVFFFCDANSNCIHAHILNFNIMKLLNVSQERKEQFSLFFMFLTLYREVLARLELLIDHMSQVIWVGVKLNG